MARTFIVPGFRPFKFAVRHAHPDDADKAGLGVYVAPAGTVLHESWLDGHADRLVGRGLLEKGADVKDKDVPEKPDLPMVDFQPDEREPEVERPAPPSFEEQVNENRRIDQLAQAADGDINPADVPGAVPAGQEARTAPADDSSAVAQPEEDGDAAQGDTAHADGE